MYNVKIKFNKGTEKFMYVCGVIDVCYYPNIIRIYKDNGITITLKAETIEHITINERGKQ